MEYFFTVRTTQLIRSVIIQSYPMIKWNRLQRFLQSNSNSLKSLRNNHSSPFCILHPIILRWRVVVMATLLNSCILCLKRGIRLEIVYLFKITISSFAFLRVVYMWLSIICILCLFWKIGEWKCFFVMSFYFLSWTSRRTHDATI